MNKTSLKKNTVFNLIKTFSAIIFPLITFPYISRVLLVNNVGKVNFSLSIVSYFSLLASLGISVYAIRECSKVRNDRNELSLLASQIFSLNVLTTIFSYILLFCLLLFYKKIENYKTLIIIQSFSILFSTLGTDWINTAMEDFQYITIRTVLFQIISLFLIFTFIHNSDDYLKYAIISLISSSGANITNIFYRKKFCDIHFTFSIDIRKHLKPIIILFVMLISQTVFNNTDVTMLGIMKGDFSVGIYTTAHRISNIIAQVITSILWVVIPRISYFFENDDFAGINNLLRKVLSYIITIGLPCIIGASLLSKDIILLIAGESYLESTKVLQILLFSVLFTIFGGGFLGNIILLPMNKEGVFMFTCMLAAILNVVLNSLLIPVFDYIGASFATLLSSIIILLVLSFNLDKRICIKRMDKLFFQPVVGVLAIFLVCVLCYNLSGLYLRLLISIFISICIYFLIQFLFNNEICVEFKSLVFKKIVEYFNIKCKDD